MVGSLISEWPTDRPCPACGACIRVRGGWVT
jgi:hypothetical protein